MLEAVGTVEIPSLLPLAAGNALPVLMAVDFADNGETSKDPLPASITA